MQVLGTYDFWKVKNGRSCYKHKVRDLFLHYNDWGVQKVCAEIWRRQSNMLHMSHV